MYFIFMEFIWTITKSLLIFIKNEVILLNNGELSNVLKYQIISELRYQLIPFFAGILSCLVLVSFLLAIIERYQKEIEELLNRYLIIYRDKGKLPSKQELKILEVKYQRVNFLVSSLTSVSFLRTPQKQHNLIQWISQILPDGWGEELQVLKNRLIEEKQHHLWIEIVTFFCILDLVKGYIQMSIENIWLTKIKKRKQS